MMKKQIIILICMVAFVCAGCSIKENNINDSSISPAIVEAETSDADDASSYYYFIKSRLAFQKNDMNKAILWLTKAIEKDPESLYLKKELAFIYFEQKDYSKAESIIEEILAHNPENIDILILQGSLKQIMKADINEIKGIYEKIIEIDHKKEEIYLTLSNLYMDDGDISNALIVYQKLVKNIPSSFTGHFFLGKINAFRGNFAVAEKELKKTIKLNPELIEPYLELLDLYISDKPWFETIAIEKGDSISKIYMQLFGKYNDTIKTKVIEYNPQLKNGEQIFAGQIIKFPQVGIIKTDNEIKSLIKKILKMYPDSYYAKIELGLLYHRFEKMEEKKEIFDQLSKIANDDQMVLNTIVKHYIDRRRNNSAIVILNAMDVEKQKNQIQYLLGVVYSSMGKINLAIQHFLNIEQKSKLYQKAVIHIAFLYREIKENDKAIAFLEKTVKSMDDNIDFIYYLGTLYEEDKMYEKAVSMLLKGIELDDTDTDIHFRLGVVYDKMKNKEACIKQLRTVIFIDPENASALNYLGYTFVDAEINLEEAEKLIKKAMLLKPDDGYITDSLGWLYYKKGLYEEAVTTLIKAVELALNDPLILEHLGDAYIKINNYQKAFETYKLSLKQNGENKLSLEKKINELEKKGFNQDEL